eukprot:12446298-Alexandrium_andersonii.AAC.1
MKTHRMISPLLLRYQVSLVPSSLVAATVARCRCCTRGLALPRASKKRLGPAACPSARSSAP